LVLAGHRAADKGNFSGSLKDIGAAGYLHGFPETYLRVLSKDQKFGHRTTLSSQENDGTTRPAPRLVNLAKQRQQTAYDAATGLFSLCT
jgi:hypothetical protein